MVPPLSTSPTAKLQIPPRRFLTQICFSALATLLPNILQYFDLLFLSFLFTLFSIAFAKIALKYHKPRSKLRSDAYLILLSYTLGYLHQLTTIIGAYSLSSAGSDAELTRAQHIAVDFCLAFVIISECEFYHMYCEVKKFKTWMDMVKGLCRANIESEHVFSVSRDPWPAFGYLSLPDTPNSLLIGKTAAVHIAQ
ncbi:hypothetical protein FB567DRAFT_592917 [Paraphoma chrysanthemicola]|uniref:Uncharacterized protein n=1 Tax=Paraphoma chrysanthemicola TaxID=798071 RepID=A0A8K0VYD8_9PLEO|nr:hypothetical protein FB567DRAFT_592917 [Paraphoma chrysanthemicola]